MAGPGLFFATALLLTQPATSQQYSDQVLVPWAGVGGSQPVAMWSCPGPSLSLFPPLPGKGAIAQGPHQVLGAIETRGSVGPGSGLAGQGPLYKWDKCQEGRGVFKVTQKVSSCEDQELSSLAGRDIPQIKNRGISRFLPIAGGLGDFLAGSSLSLGPAQAGLGQTGQAQGEEEGGRECAPPPLTHSEDQTVASPWPLGGS